MRSAVSAMDFAMQTLEPTPKGHEARLSAGTDPLSHLMMLEKASDLSDHNEHRYLSGLNASGSSKYFSSLEVIWPFATIIVPPGIG